ncbi:MAG: tetratricopeptide repeat protein [Candidatus Omnitrophota bacterium]|jgi:chromosome segregation ATPase
MNLKFNKKQIIFAINFIIILILALAAFYFIMVSRKYISLYTGSQANLSKESASFIELQDKHSKIQSDLEALIKDRDNLSIQVKGLIADRNLARQLEATVEKNKQEIEALTSERNDLTDKNLQLKSLIERLKMDQDKLAKGKKKIWDELNREKDASVLRKTEQENARLKKDYDRTVSELKASRAKIRELEANASGIQRDLDKSRMDAQDLSEKLDKMTKRYAEALEQNKKLEQKLVDEPRKYAELARQNISLLQQTADMHYNMGVFYVKQKEYQRAIAEFKKAVDLNPKDAHAYFNLGYIYAEHLVDRPKAVENFRNFIRLAKKTDKDVDWARNYLMTWETWEGKKPLD